MQLGASIKSAQARAQYMENHLLALILTNGILLTFSLTMTFLALYFQNDLLTQASQIISTTFTAIALLTTFLVGYVAFGNDLRKKLQQTPTNFMA